MTKLNPKKKPDAKEANYFVSFFDFNYPPTRLNDLGRNLDTALYVGQFQTGLGSPNRLHVIDWTPFVNQLDPLYSDTHPARSCYSGRHCQHAGGKSFHQRARDVYK